MEISLPGFALVAAGVPVLPRLWRSRFAGAFLDGVNAASPALMAVAVARLGRAAVVDGPSAPPAIAAGVLLVGFRVNPTWVVLGGAAAGLARGAVG